MSGARAGEPKLSKTDNLFKGLSILRDEERKKQNASAPKKANSAMDVRKIRHDGTSLSFRSLNSRLRPASPAAVPLLKLYLPWKDMDKLMRYWPDPPSMAPYPLRKYSHSLPVSPSNGILDRIT